MRSFTVGLLLSSPLVTAGLRTALRGISGLSITELSPADTQEGNMAEITDLSPSLMIVDSFTATECPPEIPTVLVTSIQLPESAVKRHACVLSIYDSLDTIKKRIKNLLEPASDADSRGNDLSPREKEVILGIVKGLSNKEIAHEMNVSVNTIMTHRRNIASKLEIHSPAGLTIFAIATGLVKIEDVKI